MDSIDDKLKEYLEKERQRLGRGQRDLCPPTEDFYQFIMDELKGERLEKMLGHLRNCAEDQELVIKTRRLLGEEAAAQGQKVPPGLIQATKDLFRKTARLSCPHCGKAITPFKKSPQKQSWLNWAWLSLAVASFLLSFVFRRYFFQCLVLALLFGVKWIVDQKAARTRILIYKALKEGEGKAVSSKDLHRISSHL